jgi:hypothetical protein
MILGGEEKPPLDELAHFGVKGMHWGQHKAVSMHPSYTARMQANDHMQYRGNSVQRINAHLNSGLTRKEALHKEDVRKVKQTLIIAGAAFTLTLLAHSGATPISSLASHVADRAEANRAASKLAESTIAIGSKAAKLAYAKSHGGAFNITTLK